MKTTRPEPGERHGRLVYVGGDERRQVSRFGDRPVFASFERWRCDCGTERTYRNSKVVNGCIKSCGCLRKATGEEWKKGKRVKRRPLQRLVPHYLVELRCYIDSSDPAEAERFDSYLEARNYCWHDEDILGWKKRQRDPKAVKPLRCRVQVVVYGPGMKP